MKPTILAAVLFAAIASCGPSRTTMLRYPQAPAAFDRAGSEAKAVELADKVAAAAGPAEKWAAVKQLRWGETIKNDGKTVIDGEEGWDRWNARHYGRLIREEGDVVVHREIYGEGISAWGEQPGKRVRLPDADAERASKVAAERWQFDSAVLGMPWIMEEPGTKLKYGGQANGETGPLEVILVTFDPNDKARTGSSFQVDIDPATNTIARIEIVKPAGNIGYKLSVWKEVGGLKFPTLLNNIGLATEVITFHDIVIGDPEEELYNLQY
jgi:hypothetical protein